MKPVDVHSATWLAVKALAQQEAQSCRARLESVHLGKQQTAVVRGQLLAWKKVLALETAPAVDVIASQMAPNDVE